MRRRICRRSMRMKKEDEEEEEEDKSFYGMIKAMWTIPTRSPRYLEINPKI